jgi:outer membrane protein OmpA-like peptidoglycan-associated protein
MNHFKQAGPVAARYGTKLLGWWLAIAILSPCAALGQNALDVEVRSKVEKGKRPALVIAIGQPLSEIRMQVTGEGPGAPVNAISRRKLQLKAGQKVEFLLPAQQKAGDIKWTGSLSVTFANGTTGEMPLSFVTRAVAQIRVMMERKDLDLKRHQMTFTLDRPAQKAEATIRGDDGKIIAQTERLFFGEKPGTPLTLMWQPRSQSPVLQIHLVVQDTDGFAQTVDYFPWQIHIPHEEVLFQSGQATIPQSEESKLEDVLPHLVQTEKRYGEAVRLAGQTMKLFIAGHTDTVGSKSTNKSLSERRASVIAGWFQRHGVSLSIYSQGFGESRPRVATPDETAESQNRRVDYTVALESPTGSLKGWRRFSK